MARTQAFDWLSTILLAALILIVPILFVIWVNPGLLDRLQEEIAGAPRPVVPQATPGSSTDGDAERSGDDPDGVDPDSEPSEESLDDYISTPGATPRRDDAALAEVEVEPPSAEGPEVDDATGEERTAAKPVADAAAGAEADDSGVFDESPAAGDDGAGSAESGETGSGGAVSEVEGAAAGASPPVEPVGGANEADKLSTEPGSLAVPPTMPPTGDADGDGDQGGLRPLEETPPSGSPTPAPPKDDEPKSGDAPESDAGASPAAPATPAAGVDDDTTVPSTDSAAASRHEEVLREIRSLATSQRALEEQFAALREDIDGRLNVLKSAVDGANGAPGDEDADKTDGGSATTDSTVSAAEQARATRATKILRATLDGKLTLELGDDERTTIDFVYVPPGRFRMGRTESEQQSAAAGTVAAPAQEILVERGFFLSKREITNAQFAAFLKANYADDPNLAAVLEARADRDRPATRVTWPMAKFFCLWAANEARFDIRLPTEIEWEYAARGPYGAMRPSGVDASATAAWKSARDVGDDPSDRSWSGAEDLWGNVAEWCVDLYDAEAFATDAVGGAKAYAAVPAPEDWSSTDGGGRSIRGGSFADPADSRDFSERRQAEPDSSAATLGFRVVLVPDFDGEAEVGRLP